MFVCVWGVAGRFDAEARRWTGDRDGDDFTRTNLHKPQTPNPEQLVRTTIRSVRPQTVMLELDEGRVRRVTEGAPQAAAAPQGQPPQPQPQPKQDKPGFLRMALAELTRPGTSLRDKLVGVGAVVVGQVISGLYKTLDKMGFVSGQEFLVAMEEAKAVGASILLGDRNVQVTLRRLSEALSQSDLVKIREMESPTRSPAAKELAARGLDVGPGAGAADIAVAVEALKDRDSVRKLMGALRSELPAVYEAMIAERCVLGFGVFFWGMIL